jgi:tRNA(Ile)-lysidine synthase TilS/MesJ
MTDGPISMLTTELLLRCTFPAAGSHVQCAVSGGADSLALMLLAHAAGLNVTAIHIDHGLRHNSSLDKDVIHWESHCRFTLFALKMAQILKRALAKPDMASLRQVP